MSIRAGFLAPRILVLGGLICAMVGVAPGAVSAAPNAAPVAPKDLGGGCVVYPDNRAATVDSLRFRCTAVQLDHIYLASARGAVPMGARDGWVVNPPPLVAVAPALWYGKTFTTGPDGGWLINRTVLGDIQRADVYSTASVADGKPTWALNYAPSLTPPLYDEIREVAPGVWFGYSLWRGSLQTPLLLRFMLI